MINIGMLIGDRYEILERIGAGGMSDVYKAKCHKLNRFVAVKILKPEFSENKNFVSKFRAEAQAAAGLMHPNIVNVYDVGEEDGVYYIVMELVEGITLKEYIEKKARLSVKEAVSIAIQVSMGIETAHNNNIIHRDIKPQNIIISKDGKVKVTDFGIARAVTSNTITSNVMGSVHYTSPEQARGGYSDAKSDIYSLGVTMYEMLTGRVPFDGETTVAIAIKHIQEQFPSPREYIPEIPVSVEQIIFKCTQKNPDRRYANMSDLIADLKRSLLTPDEDFVQMVPLGGSGETKAISDDDMKKIKRQTGNLDYPKYEPEETEEYYEDHEPFEEDEYYGEEDQEYSESDEGEYYGDEEPYYEDDGEYYEEEGYYPGGGYDEEEGYYEDEGYYGDDRHSDRDIDPKMEKIMTGLAVLAAVIIGCIALFLVGKTIGLFSSAPAGSEQAQQETDSEKVAMINVVGLSLEEAKSKLNEMGLGVKENYADSDKYEKNLVMEQDQPEGAQLDKHTTIVLTVSQGAAGISVPSVEGKSEAEAKVALEAEGFQVVKEYDVSDTVEKGNVISQNPAGGTSLEKGGSVTVVISSGKNAAEVMVPNLLGQTEVNAKALLTAAGLSWTTITEEESDTVPAGCVISQSYSPGLAVEEGTSVDFVLSIGSMNVTYKCNYSVTAPADYAGGAAQIALTRDDTGETLYTGSTEVFPFPLNVTGIAGEDVSVETLAATVTIAYVVNVETPVVDANGNPGTVTTPETRTETQAVTLTKE